MSKPWQMRVEPQPDEVELLLGEARRAAGGDIERWLERGGVPYGVEEDGCCGPGPHWFEHDRRGVLLWRDSIARAPSESHSARGATRGMKTGAAACRYRPGRSCRGPRRGLCCSPSVQPQQLELFTGVAA